MTGNGFLDMIEPDGSHPVKARLTKDGLSLVDPELASKAAKMKLSNSAVTAMLKCPAKFAADKWILRDIMPEDPLSANVLGSAFHKVMELFYSRPADKRTVADMRESYKEALALDEFKAVREDKEARQWVKDRINSYWGMGLEKPEEVKIASVEREGKWGPYKKNGLELYLQGKIGDSKRDTCGFIDRLCVDDDGEYLIDDWKTGKHADVFDPSAKYPDFSKVRQQILYTIMLEQQGGKVKSARLIYPKTTYVDSDGNEVEGGFVDDIPIRNKYYVRQAIKDVETVDAAVESCVERNTWDTDPSPLCSWCPLVNICPAAMKMNKANAVASREKQPTKEFLAEGGIVAD